MWQDHEQEGQQNSEQHHEGQPERLDFHPMGPPRRVVAAGGIMIAIVLAIVLAGLGTWLPVGFSGNVPPQRPTSQAGVRPVPPPSAPPVRFDARTGKFLTDGLRGTLPPTWFDYRQGYISVGTGAGGCLGNRCHPSDAAMHPLEDNIDWGVDFEIVKVEESLTGENIEQTAKKIFDYWTQYAYHYIDTIDPVVVSHKSERTITTMLPRPARLITADLHYRKPDLGHRYDNLYLIVVARTNGGYVAYLAAWSDNATSDVEQAIQESINTLQVV